MKRDSHSFKCVNEAHKLHHYLYGKRDHWISNKLLHSTIECVHFMDWTVSAFTTRISVMCQLKKKTNVNAIVGAYTSWRFKLHFISVNVTWIGFNFDIIFMWSTNHHFLSILPIFIWLFSLRSIITLLSLGVYVVFLLLFRRILTLHIVNRVWNGGNFC